MSGGNAEKNRPGEEFDVRILKCSGGGYWYKGKLGETFTVVDDDDETDSYSCVVRPHPSMTNMIDKGDCERIVKASPLATASAELVEKGSPLVADSIIRGAKEAIVAEGVRTFKTGATRDSDEGKYDIEAFFNPIVTQRRAEYMHKHRKQSDGAMRDGDNWQSGMPYRESLKSLCRHMEDVKLISRGYEVFEKDKHGEFKLEDGEKIPVTIQDAICAAQFNLDSMLLTRLTDKGE